MPPRHWLDGGTTWDHRSRILAVALQTLEDETGPNGFPLDLELDPDMNGWFEADVVINEATATVQRFTKDAKIEPGSYVIVRDGRVKPPADAT